MNGWDAGPLYESLLSSRIRIRWLGWVATSLLMALPAGSSVLAVPEDSSSNDRQSSDEPVFDLGSDITPPKPTKRVKPGYTSAARKAAVEGKVILSFIVTSKGMPTTIQIVQGLYPDLDRNAIESLKEWRFEPAKRAGKPVAVRLSIEFEFKAL
jgi:protein TonB